MQTKPVIFLITGAPGTGKTSVATALMQHFPFGLHIPVDDLREWVVSGIAHPIPNWTDETNRQFWLARQAAVQTARLYANAGFVVAIDDIIYPAEAQALYISQLPGYPIGKVVLQPTLDSALERNAQCTNKYYDTTVLTGTIRAIHQSLAAYNFAEAGWLSIDSTNLIVEQTVDEILTHVTFIVSQ
jgi:adenylylsulfate kinase-like enzyme